MADELVQATIDFINGVYAELGEKPPALDPADVADALDTVADAEGDEEPAAGVRMSAEPWKDEPRVPAGEEGGGQWTEGGGSWKPTKAKAGNKTRVPVEIIKSTAKAHFIRDDQGRNACRQRRR